MAKTGLITFRVDEETKTLIESAARRKGLTMTTFIQDAAVKAARAVSRRADVAGIFRGRPPTYFRVRCDEASRGGTGGYGAAGYVLAHNLPAADDVTSAEWAAESRKLAAMVRRGDEDAVLAWFDQHYPSCMELIPQRRRSQFAAGVFRCAEDETAGWL